MTNEPESKAAILTDIILTVFRVNGRLLEKGDQLVKPLNLTSARWQVLGAVAQAGKPLSVPQVAEAMGITRQGAQKQLNKLEKEGFFEQHRNPRHERSPFYALTELGNRTISETMTLQKIWANGLVAGLTLQDLNNTLQMLNVVFERLDSPVPKKRART
ncbi:MarR family winged helix-turn-helix transcriptional regulator [Ferrovum myxofaciens]|uniref:Winged helix-turn-helix transcriptional regulator n=1 Tax=Ferrovum myxofaciens TaxID=416213 RepID=A0A9E6MVK8_9PROT|nr:MarR family winged helix-turn-helix transcriptional regulator [Ferrovum myxofaciens]QKE39812.2 MAG: winged helix-turn-helix transcriptional regulator [Ferrovum myxofaciens]QWY74197.1 MAG: winged helix-turn-helix transcriptional regulator [Ferrovum myxofaciens]QWY76949.1 MAG: winged helix-turn-helix transcriptional regulator [Ferrovum myxofaciens]